MAEFRCESIEKYGDCAVDREQWRGEERPIQCSFCCYYKPIMTNAEKIRAMTDEELAQRFDALCEALYNEVYTKESDECETAPFPSNIDGWLEWLKQECEE